MNRAALRELVADCYRLLGPTETAHLVDGIKAIGFHYATRGGMTIAVDDIPQSRPEAGSAREADGQVAAIDQQFQRGLITEDERYESVVQSGRTPPRDHRRMEVDGVLVSTENSSAAVTSVG